ncbi:MAG: urea ABC transporter permease subunit UrtB [Oscillospiraceae bacterium]|jgi:urea transport system permease protein|nr:urea ABC transporter permease subunit UrtB [Oscillospiraceae bacterium]
MDSVLALLLNGLNSSALILMAALGMVIICGLMGVINLAHGELIMVGAYTAYCATQLLGLNFAAAMALAFAAAALAGILMEVLVVRRLAGRPAETMLATFGISVLLQQLVNIIFGAQSQYVAIPIKGNFSIGKVVVPYYNIFTVCFVAAVMAGTVLLMKKTKFGRRVRAITQNRDMAECLGIDSARVDTVTFAFGSGLAGLAGALAAPVKSVSPFMGGPYLVNSFMTSVVGGIASFFGTAVGSLMVGESTALLGGVSNDVTANILVFLMIIAVIRFKPEGLFAKERR